MFDSKDIIGLISDTYAELTNIKRHVNIFDSSRPFKHNVFVIEVALGLFQLGYFVNRPIQESEEYWFEGGYYIHYDFDGAWEKLANNYSKIVELTSQMNFFRDGDKISN